MKYKVRALVLFIATLSSWVFAGAGEVKRIYPQGGKVNFQLKNDSCNAAYNYYYFDASTTEGQTWYSLLLASAASNKSVSVRTFGDDETCNPNENKQVRYIYVDY